MAVSTAHPKVLVAGGAGYIGSHTCKALAAGGFLPVVYDNLSTGHRGFVRWGPLVEGDLLDQRTFEHTFAEHRPVAVLHFAACAYVGESFEDPARYYSNNVIGALRLLDAARSAGKRPSVTTYTSAISRMRMWRPSGICSAAARASPSILELATGARFGRSWMRWSGSPALMSRTASSRAVTGIPRYWSRTVREQNACWDSHRCIPISRPSCEPPMPGSRAETSIPDPRR